LTRDSYLLTNNALDTTAELLGVDSAEAVAKLAAELRGGDGRAQVITLALVPGGTGSSNPRTPDMESVSDQ